MVKSVEERAAAAGPLRDVRMRSENVVLRWDSWTRPGLVQGETHWSFLGSKLASQDGNLFAKGDLDWQNSFLTSQHCDLSRGVWNCLRHSRIP